MNLKWKRILISIAIASICFLALIPVVDHLRIWAAGSVGVRSLSQKVM
ncbi:hypothetical protein H6F95_07315 [Cyanobacteria bacterium FACHB-471]|nr:hypothetical protein [Cyanobacteria bacterium FACHB-471]